MKEKSMTSNELKNLETESRPLIPKEIAVWEWVERPIPLKSVLFDCWRREWPLLLSRTLRGGITFWGMRMLAGMGHDYNAAEANINSLQILVTALTLLPFSAVNIRVSTQYRDKTKCGSIINSAVASFLHAAIAGSLAVVALGYVRPIMESSGQPENLITISENFFNTFRYALISGAVLSSCSNTLTAIDNTVPIAVTNIVAAAASLFAEYFFIKGSFGGQPEYEVGLAKALIVEFSVPAALLFSHVVFRLARNREFRSSFSIKEIAKELLLQLGIGFGMDIIVGTEVSAIFVIVLLVGKYLGSSALGQYNIISQYTMITLPLQLAIRNVIMAMMGNLKGARNQLNQQNKINDPEEIKSRSLIITGNAKRVIAAGAINSAVISIPQLLFYVSATPLLITNFTDESSPAFIRNMRLLFAVSFAGQIFDGFRNIYNSAYFGNQNIIFPLIMSIIFVLGGGISFSDLALHLDWELLGVVGINSGVVLLAALVSSIWWSCKEQNKLAYIQTTANLFQPSPSDSNANENGLKEEASIVEEDKSEIPSEKNVEFLS